MTDFKLILLDVDGTTVASNGEALPSERVIRAVKQAQQKLHVGLATGRPMELAENVIDALGLHGLSVFDGGAEVIDITTGDKPHTRYLDPHSLRELHEVVSRFDRQMMYFHNGADEYITSLEQCDRPLPKVLVEGVPMDIVIAMLQELTSVEGIIAHPTTSWVGPDVMDIHMNHEHATKRYGVEKLIELMGISQGQVMAIGDGHNDVPLLEAAGFKVAMGNAPDEVKAIADFVTTSIDEDGVAVAIEKFILR